MRFALKWGDADIPSGGCIARPRRPCWSKPVREETSDVRSLLANPPRGFVTTGRKP